MWRQSWIFSFLNFVDGVKSLMMNKKNGSNITTGREGWNFNSKSILNKTQNGKFEFINGFAFPFILLHLSCSMFLSIDYNLYVINPVHSFLRFFTWPIHVCFPHDLCPLLWSFKNLPSTNTLNSHINRDGILFYAMTKLYLQKYGVLSDTLDLFTHLYSKKVIIRLSFFPVPMKQCWGIWVCLTNIEQYKSNSWS